MNRVLIGIVGLLGSKKGVLSLLILGGSLTALLMGKLEGSSFAAVVATIGSIYCWTQHRTDIASLGIKSNE